MTPLTGDLGKADLAVLERWVDSRALLAASLACLARLIIAILAPLVPGGMPAPSIFCS